MTRLASLDSTDAGRTGVNPPGPRAFLRSLAGRPVEPLMQCSNVLEIRSNPVLPVTNCRVDFDEFTPSEVRCVWFDESRSAREEAPG